MRGEGAAPRLVAAIKHALDVPANDFELPRELRTLSSAELRAAVQGEEAMLRDDNSEQLYDSDDEEPEWRAPWRHAPGTTVWARSQGFPFWPARVEAPAAEGRYCWCELRLFTPAAAKRCPPWRIATRRGCATTAGALSAMLL